MPTKSLLTQEDSVESVNIANAPRFAAGNPLSGKSLEPIRQEGLDKISENLASMWELMKHDSPAYQKVDRVFVSANQDAGDLLLKSRLKRRWQWCSATTHKSVLFNKEFYRFP